MGCLTSTVDGRPYILSVDGYQLNRRVTAQTLVLSRRRRYIGLHHQF